jgi:hypothetical protein
MPISKGVSEQELKVGAAYFSSLKPQQMMTVKDFQLPAGADHPKSVAADRPLARWRIFKAKLSGCRQ